MAAVARRAAEGVCRAQLVVEDMHRCAEASQTGVSLRYMMEFGARASPRNLVRSAEFLRRELPLRLARRVLELDSMPFGLSSMPPVVKVRDWYFDSFRELRSFPQIKDMEDELAFTQLLKMVTMRHNNVVPVLATGLNQLKNDMPSKVGDSELEEIHRFLDRFYMSRIGIRMLAGQHVALHDADKEPGCVGLVNTRMSPVLVAQHASEDARTICLREYGSAPDVNIYGNPDFTFPYVPSHLYLMMFELVKNSLRAVQERYMNSDKEPPPVRIIVAEGIEDVAIKICDEGGGIPRSVLPKIFAYSYTTAEKPIEDNYIYSARYNGITMAGYGYGLPISRLYARYFGGDLQVISMEGYGTDAYLHLCRLGDSKEPLS